LLLFRPLAGARKNAWNTFYYHEIIAEPFSTVNRNPVWRVFNNSHVHPVFASTCREAFHSP
jgi:hypothetical protein